MKIEEALQDMFDLMANQQVKIEIEGEVNHVDGTLCIWNRRKQYYDVVAEAFETGTFDECLIELVSQMQAKEEADG